VNDLKTKIPADVIARKFHNTIVDIIISVAETIRKDSGITNIVLTGGVFQNALLLENSFSRLKEKGFSPFIHQIVPPNDGGISLGQAVYAHFHQL
jgi:hydrogenase maturation protein HypF